MNWLQECLTSNGKVSSKRLITILSFILIAIGFLSNLFFNFTVDANLFEAVQWIVLGGLGTVASEGFTKKGDKDTPS